MRKYQVVANCKPMKSEEYWEARPFLPNLNVYEPDDSPVYTGLVDMHERPIYAIPDKPLIGFTYHKSSSD